MNEANMIDIHPDIRKFWESAGWIIYMSAYGDGSDDCIWWDLFGVNEDPSCLQSTIYQPSKAMRWYPAKHNIAFYNGSSQRMGYRFPGTTLLYSEKRMLRLIKMKAFL